LRNEYEKRHAINAELRLNHSTPSEETSLKELDIFEDNFIVFHAIDKGISNNLGKTTECIYSTMPLANGFDETSPEQNGIADHMQLNTSFSSNHLLSIPLPKASSGIDDCTENTEKKHKSKPRKKDSNPSSPNASILPMSQKYMLHLPPSNEWGSRDRDLANKTNNSQTSYQPSAVMLESQVHGYIFRNSNIHDEIVRHDSKFKESSKIVEAVDPVRIGNSTTVNAIDHLERSVRKAVGLLRELRQILEKHLRNEYLDYWIKSIDELVQQSLYAHTVIGIVGKTGAGKSSVINAVLDEEIPLSLTSMAFYTPVIVELSWNESNQPTKKYRAEIEFIKLDEWKNELETLCRDLLDENGGFSSDFTNMDTKAGVAYTKIMAVYPFITKHNVTTWSPEELLTYTPLSKVLGTIKKLYCTNCLDLYHNLQMYFNSERKGPGDEEDHKSETQQDVMELWPLIKVVRIYLRSPALSSGAVILDLPEVRGSNAARAALIAGYVKRCTDLWIIAPITHTVDGIATIPLLEDTVEHQWQYDGIYATVTFICSKTDDISILDAIEALGLENDIAELQLEIEQTNDHIASLKQKVEKDIKTRPTYANIAGYEDDGAQSWSYDGYNLDDDGRASPPKGKNLKISPFSSTCKPPILRSHNRQGSSESALKSMLDHHSKSQRNENGPIKHEHSLSQEQLTSDAIGEKTERTEAGINANLVEATIPTHLISTLVRIDQLRENCAAAQSDISAICIAGRNEYLKRAIRLDFKNNIETIDVKNAVEEFRNGFDKNQGARDYVTIADSPPIYCVSSLAYRYLSNRQKQDTKVQGFTDIKQSEIPQLRNHYEKLTEAGITTACKNFQHRFSQLLSSMTDSTLNDNTLITFSKDEHAVAIDFLAQRLQALEKLRVNISLLIKHCRMDGTILKRRSYVFDNKYFSCGLDLGKSTKIVNEA
jgi:hypothetical protein